MARRPDRRDDWRKRMAVRGGPVTHAIARAGWLVFAMLGAVVMIGVAVLYAMNPGADSADNGVAANFVGGLIVMLPIGAVLGALLGLPAQFAARSWLRSPSKAERQAALERGKPAKRNRVPAHGLRAAGRWARSYEACERSVTAFHAIVAAVPAGAGRDWLTAIGKTLDEELAEALRLARIGESLEAGSGELGETGLRVLDQLNDAERKFAETTERAAVAALALRDDTDFARVQAQLDMLAEQAPHLRETDV